MKLSDRKGNPDIDSSVFIVILNWNGLNDTIECIESISRISYKNITVVVVDNGSVKDESKELAIMFPNVITIRSETNLGFSGGCNLGIQYALKNEADYILLINNDTIVEKHFMNILLEEIKKDRYAALAVPKINYYNNPSTIWYAGGYFSKLRGTAVSTGQGKSENLYQENKYVTFATGCCLLIDRKVISDIGLLDEKYFLYLEDADFCWRAINAGYKIIFVPQSKIFHKVNASSSDGNEILPLYFMTRNRLYFTHKHFSAYNPIVFLYILLSMGIKSFIWLFSGKARNIVIVKKAISDFKSGYLGKMKDDQCE